MVGATVGLIPWIVYLGVTLPAKYTAHNWTVTWVGFDLLLLIFMAAVALVLLIACANVMSLLTDLRGHLRDLDLSRLAIRGAYLQGVEMQDARLSGATLHEVVWTSAFDTIRRRLGKRLQWRAVVRVHRQVPRA